MLPSRDPVLKNEIVGNISHSNQIKSNRFSEFKEYKKRKLRLTQVGISVWSTENSLKMKEFTNPDRLESIIK